MEEEVKKEEFVVVHVNKKDNTISNYYCSNREKEKVMELAIQWNKNEKNTDFVTIIDDPIVVQLIGNTSNFYSNKSLADRLRNFTRDMQDVIGELNYVNDQILSRLDEIERENEED